MNTIVSAADAKYWRSLYQFLRSAERARLQAEGRFIAYDLGLGHELRQRLERRFRWCTFRDFPFGAFPPHVALDRRSYAWKVLLLSEVAEEGGLVLWLDSATLFHVRDLGFLWQVIRANGAYALKGQSTLEEHCDPLVLDALSVPPSHRNEMERVAGVIGLNCDNVAIRELISQWRTHALDESHIAPRQPPLERHRPEQALLTILLHRYQDKELLRLTEEDIDISSPEPIRWMSSRNKVPTWMPLCADPLVRLYYATYKKIDQALWRRRIANGR